jgi:hypothetical protein
LSAAWRRIQRTKYTLGHHDVSYTKWLLVLAARAVPARATSQGAAPRCLAYEPDTVAITGTLERRVFPGGPNFESIAAGDEPEAGFYLRLARPICARLSPAQLRDPDPVLAARDRVTLVQLNLDSAGYARLRPRLGQRLTLRGTLYSSHTGHHHAPLVLAVVLPRADAR